MLPPPRLPSQFVPEEVPIRGGHGVWVLYFHNVCEMSLPRSNHHHHPEETRTKSLSGAVIPSPRPPCCCSTLVKVKVTKVGQLIDCNQGYRAIQANESGVANDSFMDAFISEPVRVKGPLFLTLNKCSFGGILVSNCLFVVKASMTIF